MPNVGNVQKQTLKKQNDMLKRLAKEERREFGGGSFLKPDGTVPLTAEWDIGEDMAIKLERLEARDAEGILIQDDGGNNAIVVRDGGKVTIGENASGGGMLNIRDVQASTYGFETETDSTGRGFQVVTTDYVAGGGVGSTLTMQMSGGTGNVTLRLEAWNAGKTSPGNLAINQQSLGFVGIRLLAPASPLHVYENTSAVDATAGVTIEQDGAGDAVIQLLLTGGQRVVIGIDNSDSDALGIAFAADLANKMVRLSTAGLLDIKAGTSSGVEARVGGVLFKSTTQTASVGTDDYALLTYTVPANTLAVNLDSIRFRAWGSTANNANAKTLRAFWGGLAGDQIFSFGLDASSAEEWVLEGEIYRTGASTGKGFGWFIHDDFREADMNGALAQAHSGGIDFVIAGNGVSDNDILIEGCTIEFLPNNT